MAFSRTQQPQYADSQGYLVISATPVAARNLIGKRLIDVGAIDVEGDYECEFATDGMNTIEAVLRPSAVTGTFAPTLRSMYYNRVVTRDSDAGANFAAGVAETLTLTNLRGAQVAKVTFSVPASGSVTFAPGTAFTAALAEYNGL